MPTADGIPASFRFSKPSLYKKPQPACQIPARSLGPALSSAIFLLNFKSPYRESLAIVLRNLGHKLFVPEEYGKSVHQLKDEEFQQAEFILFDLTRLNHDRVWLPLRRICYLRKSDGMPVFVHCFSSIDHGSDFHLMVEKLGARMDYYAA